MSRKEFYDARKKAAELTTDLEWLVAVGTALFGERWQKPFAEFAGLTTGHLSGIVHQKVPITPKLKMKIVDALERSRHDLYEDAIYKIRMVADAIVRFRGE